jgi:hypothetical protein
MTERDAYNHDTDPDDSWRIEPTVDNGEMFHIDSYYTLDEFQRILRVIIARHLDNPQTTDLVSVLELWEKRAIDLAVGHEEKGADILVGFNQGEDGVTRLSFVIDTLE